MWDRQKLVYLAIFDVKDLSAAAPAFEDVLLTCDVAKVCGTVTSHVRHFPLDHGITVTPSGLFPSGLQRPKGSFFRRYSSSLNHP